MPHRGQVIVDIVEIDANAVHQPSKPGDEVVVVLNGILRLTTDADGDVQDILAGEAVLIPAGWAGLYRVIGERGRFRELAGVDRKSGGLGKGGSVRVAIGGGRLIKKQNIKQKRKT